MIKNTILIIAFTLFFTSCGIIQIASQENFRKSLEKYVGNSIDEVVNDLSHADIVSKAPNGNRLFVYSSSHTSTSSVNCKERGDKVRCTGGNVREHWCKVYFEVDKENTVLKYTYKGNSCRICGQKTALLCF